MTHARNLVESSLFRSYWDDGLVDLLSGLALLTMGLGWIGGLGALAVVQAPFWVVLWVPLRRRLVEPRAGFVRFSSSRRKSSERELWWTVAAGVGALAFLGGLLLLLRVREPGSVARLLAPGLPAALVAVGAVLVGALTRVRRFFAYGAVLCAGAAATVLFATGPALPLVVGGVVQVVSGAALFTRFVRASRDYEESV